MDPIIVNIIEKTDPVNISVIEQPVQQQISVLQKGSPGYTPIKGVDYFDGAVGAQGPKGDKGDLGDQGPQGASGAQGLKGDKGDTGATGPQGEQGHKGDKGNTGNDGYTPIKGVDYFDGAQGPQGPQGVQGPQGEQGIQGAKGDPGNDGYTPIKGVDYFDGAQGAQGPAGAKGVKGDKGDPGNDGYTPIKGVDYFDGAQGAQGPQGIQGLQGVQGPQGEQGPQGNAGTTDYNNLSNKPSIPNQLSNLSDDTTHRLVTDTEKSTWNGKQDSLGYTAENVSNKENSIIDTSTTKYPTIGLLKSSLAAQRDAANPSYLQVIEEDFITSVLTAWNVLTGAAVSSGTMGQAGGVDANHPGVIYLRDSTTQNGGYYVMTSINSIRVSGGEKAIFIFQDRNTTTRATSSFKMGFMDSQAIQTAPTDGAWAEVVGGVAKGWCKNNAGPTGTSTTYSLSQNTWYKLVIEVNADATLVTFTLYECSSGNQLWQASVNANIPTASGRETGFGVIAGETSTDAAADICWVDYISLEINRSLTR
jgi:hypothetical protein